MLIEFVLRYLVFSNIQAAYAITIESLSEKQET